ncbi:agmatinase [Mesorhizobium sp. M1233]|uniref:agmatinase n=1 Tax=Mesorhizobium sp. M1233 TaxID=2957072 RepID=UPI00333814F4
MKRPISDFAPADANLTPRFADVATFMRSKPLPIDKVGEIDVGIVGVPFDLGTLYRVGSRHGPISIREQSRPIKPVNFHTKVAPYEIARIADLGDAPVHPLSIDLSFETITSWFNQIKYHGVRPLVLGGDHTLSLPVLRGLARDGAVGLIQFDAHSDTSDETRGMKISHGTPFRRAIEEGLLDPKRIVQIGLRGNAITVDDNAWAREVGITSITMDDFEERGRAAVIESARAVVGNLPTYATFDIDGLDAVYCPGTGVPEPGGFTMRDALVILRSLQGIDVIGADVVEVCPPLDVADATARNAAYLAFEMLCLLASSSQASR